MYITKYFYSIFSFKLNKVNLQYNNSLQSIIDDITKKLPFFPISASQIKILDGPNAFYNQIKILSALSRKRITIASLYIGCNNLEKELINIIQKNIDENCDVKTTILLDYTRGTRCNKNEESSINLLTNIASKATIALYLSPLLSKVWNKKILLPRSTLNEIVSLQHIKCYLFDDTVIMSGANLSESYFTNRQDRYICFHNCKPLADYLDELIHVFTKFSLKLTQDNKFELNPSWKYHPLNRKCFKLFKKAAHEEISKLQSKHCSKLKWSNEKTIVVPLLQAKLFNIQDDYKIMCKLLSSDYSKLKLVSAYFNLNSEYIRFLSQSNKESHILIASERANGFYGEKGLKQYIPSVYTYWARQFYQIIEKSAYCRLKLWSYFRDGWTFHSKGLWLEYDSNYLLNIIGSTNYGHRSVARDLELQLLILTLDDDLKENLNLEAENLWNFASLITSINQLPKVPFFVKINSTILKSYF